jgi:hypothetical protein
VVCSTLNAWAKRPEIPSNGKHSATVTGAPEPGKNYRPAITAHTFDPPSPSLFEKPNWQIYEETNHQQHRMSTTVRCTKIIDHSGQWLPSLFKKNRYRKMARTAHCRDNIRFHRVVVAFEILVLNGVHQCVNRCINPP